VQYPVLLIYSTVIRFKYALESFTFQNCISFFLKVRFIHTWITDKITVTYIMTFSILESRLNYSRFCKIFQCLFYPHSSQATLLFTVKRYTSPHSMPWRPRGWSRSTALPIHHLGARRDEWSAPRPGHITTGKDPVPIVQDAGWTSGPVRTGTENLARTGIRSPDRPVCSESIYLLRYPGRTFLFKSSLTNMILRKVFKTSSARN
jgi:hypothetical protein